MPFIRPTFSTLLDQVQQDIRSAGLKMLPKTVLSILGRAVAALSYEHTQYLDYIAKQSTVFTANSEYLEAWAALKGLFRKASAPAVGGVSFQGLSGILIPSGTEIARSDGVAYLTTSDFITGTTPSVGIVCETSGSLGNASNATMTMTTIIPGVTSQATLIGSLTGGADVELDDSLRTRTLYEFSRTPAGGSDSDIVSWALDVPGVTRAWAKGSGAGPGSTVVYTMWDNAETSTAGFPVGSNGAATLETRYLTATGDQLTVANYIYDLRPVTMVVVSCAPVAFPILIGISGLNVSATVEASILAALQGLFLEIGTPLGGLIQPSQISQAVQGVVGSSASFALTYPTSSIATPLGTLPTITQITYT